MIRIVESNQRTRTDTVQVYSNQIVVKREPLQIRVQCERVTSIGLVPCPDCAGEHPNACYRVIDAVKHIATQRGLAVEWFDANEGDNATWSNGTRLDNVKWSVTDWDGNVLGYVVVHPSAEQSKHVAMVQYVTRTQTEGENACAS